MTLLPRKGRKAKMQTSKQNSAIGQDSEKKGIQTAEDFAKAYAHANGGCARSIMNLACFGKPAEVQKVLDADEAVARFRRNVKLAIDTLQGELAKRVPVKEAGEPDFASMSPAQFKMWQASQKKK
jgi:hypothetical protein